MFVPLLITLLVVICLSIATSYRNPLDWKLHFLGKRVPIDFLILFFRTGPRHLHP